jgi:hypothetical protein
MLVRKSILADPRITGKGGVGKESESPVFGQRASTITSGAAARPDREPSLARSKLDRRIARKKDKAPRRCQRRLCLGQARSPASTQPERPRGWIQ